MSFFTEIKEKLADVGVAIWRTNDADPGGEYFFAIRGIHTLGPLTLDEVELLFIDARHEAEQKRQKADRANLRSKVQPCEE